MNWNPQQLEAELIEAQGPPLANWPAHFVLPRYDGRSIANLPPTIGHLLGHERGWRGVPLDEALWTGWGEDIERVVLLLVDGLGWQRWVEMLELHDPTFLQQLEAWGAEVRPITTVAPSTTSVATTTLFCDGSTPIEHGMLGYTFLLAEKAAVCNLLFWRPAGQAKGGNGSLMHWGIKPEEFLSVPSIAQVLARGGIETTVFMPHQITNSPLSQMQMREAKVAGFLNETSLFLQLNRWLEETSGRRSYCYAYYPDFDTFSHIDSPDAPSWDALWRSFAFHWRDFMDHLSPAARHKTLFLITADHGHISTPVFRQRFLPRLTSLTRHLALMAGGEPRHNYFYARAGHRQAIREYCESTLQQDFHLLTTEDAIQMGLYGPPTHPHPDAERRLGDFVLLSKGDAAIWHYNKLPNSPLLGMHGSLTPEEMIVPLIGMRLDA